MNQAAVKPNAKAKASSRGVQSIEMGARLLTALADESEPMMLKDLAQVAGFAPAQAHAYLVSYKNIELVEQDAETGRYRLGPMALELGLANMQTIDPFAMASETISELSSRTGLHVAIVVWGSFGPTVTLVKESGSQLNMNTRPGTVYSLTGTASGRVFSAFLPSATVKRAMSLEKREKAGTGRVGTHRFLSRAEIEQIRESGYATVENPPIPGISAFSAPVFDHSDQMVMAITIIGQDFYLLDRAESEFVPALLGATQKLSAELGYIPAY
ncbi:IclR family transcriptional regulator [Sinisalibacter aestuarii]|uniref:Transcriptional regulator n=1 Tax=Sinisalibacter aestuarii TaxID=2949426 RepID=A0ABQ5LQ00_9RHOB|nr:IclR family transcriptional regulator [Sinisalibacter aestuarii]GKY87075.1 transcriptional regulator [Sinisalibacter aestuarii]